MIFLTNIARYIQLKEMLYTQVFYVHLSYETLRFNKVNSSQAYMKPTFMVCGSDEKRYNFVGLTDSCQDTIKMASAPSIGISTH